MAIAGYTPPKQARGLKSVGLVKEALGQYLIDGGDFLHFTDQELSERSGVKVPTLKQWFLEGKETVARVSAVDALQGFNQHVESMRPKSWYYGDLIELIGTYYMELLDYFEAKKLATNVLFAPSVPDSLRPIAFDRENPLVKSFMSGFQAFGVGEHGAYTPATVIAETLFDTLGRHHSGSPDRVLELARVEMIASFMKRAVTAQETPVTHYARHRARIEAAETETNSPSDHPTKQKGRHR